MPQIYAENKKKTVRSCFPLKRSSLETTDRIRMLFSL